MTSGLAQMNWLALVAWASGLLLAGVVAYWGYVAFTHPMINDISTDLENPPVFRSMPGPSPYPGEAFARLQRKAYPRIEPLRLRLPPERAFSATLALVRERGWEVIAADETGLSIEAIATTRLLRFTDEIAIRLRPDAAGTRVDMRSRSRLGRSDLGTNAARIGEFLEELSTRQ